MYKRIFLFMALVALTFSAQAKVRLPHIICDNIVLQQQAVGCPPMGLGRTWEDGEGDHFMEQRSRQHQGMRYLTKSLIAKHVIHFFC